MTEHPSTFSAEERPSMVEAAAFAAGAGAFDLLPFGALLVSESGLVLAANAHAKVILGDHDGAFVGGSVERVLGPVSEPLGQLTPSMGDLERTRRVKLEGGRELVLSFRVVKGARAKGPYLVVLERAGDGAEGERDKRLRLSGLGEILPTILHELKTPLAAVTTFVELMLEEAESDAMRADLSSVLAELRRMGLTIEGVGAVGRSLVATRYAAVDLAAREVCEVLARQAASVGVKLDATIEPMPLLPLEPAVVRTIFYNLITNAVQASAAGQRVKVRCGFERQSRLVLTVIDEGAGMSPEVLSRCRELFFTTKPRGTGIGLALVSKVVEEAGGELEIFSTEGEGTAVVIKVPVKGAPRASVPPRAG